ncbi:MAG: hypothetical protein ABSH51_32710, partial [Solirubrobacteraceae bacterium]
IVTVDDTLSPATETVTLPDGSLTLAAGYAVVGTPAPAKLGGGLDVTTFNQSGQPAPLAFHIAVIC